MVETSSAKQPSILVVNGSEDTLGLLGEILEEEGFRVWGVRAWELEHGRMNPGSLLRLVDPDVIVYDISLPYDLSWAYYAQFSALPDAQGRPVVLTTTNLKGAEAVTGKGVLELLLKPYDIGQLVERVRAALPERVEPPRRARQ
jgi:DNA-binding response OmpR family regulator